MCFLFIHFLVRKVSKTLRLSDGQAVQSVMNLTKMLTHVSLRTLIQNFVNQEGTSFKDKIQYSKECFSQCRQFQNMFHTFSIQWNNICHLEPNFKTLDLVKFIDEIVVIRPNCPKTAYRQYFLGFTIDINTSLHFLFYKIVVILLCMTFSLSVFVGFKNLYLAQDKMRMLRLNKY